MTGIAVLPPATLLVTGASGFVGRHLLAALHRRWPNAVVHATSQEAIDAWPEDSGVHWHRLDICHTGRVAALLRHLHPDAIIHLAAQSHVPTSFQQPALTWRVNLQGTLNLLEGVKQESPWSLVLNVGSSDMYGGAFRSGEPVTEQTAFHPLNPYAASKASADLAAGQYAASDGLRVIRARPFNHTGPGQRDDFVLAAFATQIARIEAGLQPPVVETGNLDAQRDFLDVEDVVSAYLALLELPEAGLHGQAYNIASGHAVAVGELLDSLLARARCPIDHRLDPARQRPADIQTVRADTTALRQATGWQPLLSHGAMLDRLLNDCRRRVVAAAQ
ncbi:GDP-mannose 4,6-dehydratase [Halomonas tibetensis]|uniref:GDP-mannose 4,6-dehydratase n=1 Tax=Halomonas tibetensis TaxID=2259590 RepID=A0ABV7B501_9GAMM